MLTFLKGLPVASRLAVIGGIILLFVLAVVIGKHFIDRAFSSARTEGAATSAAAAANEGLAHVEDSNAAAAAVARDPAVRDAECVRNSRSPENC